MSRLIAPADVQSLATLLDVRIARYAGLPTDSLPSAQALIQALSEMRNALVEWAGTLPASGGGGGYTFTLGPRVQIPRGTNPGELSFGLPWRNPESKPIFLEVGVCLQPGNGFSASCALESDDSLYLGQAATSDPVSIVASFVAVVPPGENIGVINVDDPMNQNVITGAYYRTLG
jgi:hypothetical protein